MRAIACGRRQAPRPPPPDRLGPFPLGPLGCGATRPSRRARVRPHPEVISRVRSGSTATSPARRRTSRWGGRGDLRLRTSVVDRELAHAIGRGTEQVVLVGVGLRRSGAALRQRRGAMVRGRRRRGAGRQAPPARRSGSCTRARGLRRRRLRICGPREGPRRTWCRSGGRGTRPDPAVVLRVRECPDFTHARRDGHRLFHPARLRRAGERAGCHLRRRARGHRSRRRRCASQRAPRPALSAIARPDELRPGDPEKLMVVTGWRVIHAEHGPDRLLDRGTHQLVFVCEPERIDLDTRPRPSCRRPRDSWSGDGSTPAVPRSSAPTRTPRPPRQ